MATNATLSAFIDRAGAPALGSTPGTVLGQTATFGAAVSSELRHMERSVLEEALKDLQQEITQVQTRQNSRGRRARDLSKLQFLIDRELERRPEQEETNRRAVTPAR